MPAEDILSNLKIMSLAKEWPEFKALHDNARAALLAANVEAQAEITERAEAEAKKAAEAQAKIDAKARADRERDAAQSARPVQPPTSPIAPVPPIARRPE